MTSGNEFSPERRLIETRGLKTEFFIALPDQGHPSGIVFFCHGFPDNGLIWKEQMRRLKSQFIVIAPNVRGCEGSEPPSHGLARYRPEAILLDHLEILKSIDPAGKLPINVIGHDLGAVHAIELARALEEKVKGAVILNGIDCSMFLRRLNRGSQAMKSWYMGVMQLPVIPELLFKTAPSSVSWLTQKLGGTHSSAASYSVEERRTVAPLNQYRAFFRSLITEPAVAKRLSCPILILWGKDDGFLDIPTRDEWERICLAPTIRILKGGHWLQRDHSSEVNPLIEEFIAVCSNLKNPSTAKESLYFQRSEKI